MPSKNRGLGRGLDSLIPTKIETEFDPTAEQDDQGKRVSADSIQQLKPDNIEPNPHQPRQHFDEALLDSLASSIKLHGILQPLVVSDLGGGQYQLIAGERRLRAAKKVGLETVPAIVRSFDEQEKLELALIENIQREDLNPLELATAYQKLVDQFNMHPAEIGDKVGRDRSTIINTIRLLNLPVEAKRALAEGRISEGHGRVILSVSDPVKQQTLLDLIQKNSWTVRQAEEFARDFKPKTGSAEKGFKRIAGSNELTDSVAEYLGTKVQMQPTAKGGRLIIEYYSDEELERIADAIVKRDR